MPAWLPIIQGIGTGLNFLTNYMNRPKRFSKTEYGRRLKQLSQTGIYSPVAKSNILGQVGSQTGTMAQQAKAGYKGRLIAQGMGGSIAGQRGMTDIDVQRMSQMGGVAKGIETENELAKAQYATQYAQAASQYGEQRQDYDRNMLTGLVQGAVGTLGTYAQELQQQKEFGLKEKQVTGELEKQGKYYDYLRSKAAGDRMPDVRGPVDEMLNYIYGARNEQEKADRQRLMFLKLKEAGLLEKYMSIMGYMGQQQ